MLRIVLIAAGVVTTALTGWFVKRKFSRTPEETQAEMIEMPHLYPAAHVARKPGVPSRARSSTTARAVLIPSRNYL